MADLDEILNLPPLKPPMVQQYKKTNYKYLGYTGYQCNYCGEILSTLSKTKNHIMFKHHDESIDYSRHYAFKSAPNYCVICKKTKEHLHNFKVHPDFTCTICNKKFKNAKYFRLHLETHLPNKYNCIYCNHGSSQISNMKYHIYTKHLDFL